MSNHLSCPSESDFTLGCLSARGAERWPHAVALRDSTRTLTFADLERAVASFAALLRDNGVQPGERVAILASKAMSVVIAMLGTARAGATYVAVDPCLPPNRLDFMLKDCGTKRVIGERRNVALAGGKPFIASELCWDDAPVLQAELATPKPHDVAYVLYTSGSTGYPKGVQIEHRNILAFFLAHNANAAIRAGDRCLNTGPLYFDVSVLDVFLPLYFGASVTLTPELPLPSLVLLLIERERITHFYAVGSVLALLTGEGRRLDDYDLSSLRMLQTGAEVCNPKVVNEWLRRLPAMRFLNSYGPTELTVGCTAYLKPEPGPLPDAEVPIGMLHNGSHALLLDEHGEPTDGPDGELAVSGDQLMRGYLNRPEEEPAKLVVIAGRRYYRTGDLVLRDAAGCLYYRGRRDHEVKIGGQRIHLNEIKRCLEAQPGVLRAVVGLMHSDRRGKLIGAAVMMREDSEREQARGLLKRLGAELPAPFVPSALLVTDGFPLTPTGKVDAERLMRVLEQQRRLAETTALIHASSQKVLYACSLFPSSEELSLPFEQHAQTREVADVL